MDKQRMTQKDTQQIARYEHDDVTNAKRVTVVGGKVQVDVEKLSEELSKALQDALPHAPAEKEIKVEQIEVPVFVKEQEVQVVEIPTVEIIKEIEKVEVPVIVKEIQVIEVEKSVIVPQPKIEVVEVEKPVIIERIERLEVPVIREKEVEVLPAWAVAVMVLESLVVCPIIGAAVYYAIQLIK